MRTVFIIVALFIRAAIMNAVLTKYSISDSVLTEDCDMSRNPHISRPRTLTSNDP